MNSQFKLLFLVIICAWSTAANSQDIHFSQFNENASLVNPALTGQQNAIKASAIYKSQWRSITVPYKTYGASFEMRFKSGWTKTGGHSTSAFKSAFSRMAGGLSVFTDKAGDGNMGMTQANLSLATFVPVGEKSTLSVGLQGSVVQRKVDYSKLIWPDQYNGAGYDPASASGENVSGGNFVYPDFAAGVLWSYGYGQQTISSNDQFTIDLGFAAHHVSAPKLSYLVGTNEKLNRKYTFHGKSLIGFKNTNFSLAPAFILQFQGKSKEIILGTLLRYSFGADSKYTGNMKSTYFSFGAFYRNSDALIACAQLELGQYAVGFSYDVNISGLTSASASRGGFEVFLRFTSANSFLYQNKSKKMID